MNAKSKIEAELGKGWEQSQPFHGAVSYEHTSGVYFIIDYDASGNLFGAEFIELDKCTVVKGHGSLERIIWKIRQINEETQ